MSFAKSSFLRTTSILLVIGFLALVAIVAASIWLVSRTESSFDAMLQARDARAVTVDLRKSVQEMEAAQRGYLLAEDPRYLDPYQKARNDITGQYSQLQEALKAFPEEAAAASGLGQALREKIAEMEQTIALVREGRRQEALDIVRSDRGERIMQDARATFQREITAADARLAAAVDGQRSNVNWLRIVTIAGGLVILAVAAGMIWVVLLYTRELVAARTELENFNAELEARVVERSEDLIRANEEIQRFAYIVTHDLRAPLVNIMGFTAELEETMQIVQAYVLADGEPLSQQEVTDARTAAAEDLPEALGFIRSSTRKMDGLINAILKISREGRRPLSPESIKLSELLEATAASVHHQVSETEGAINIDANIPAIISDKLSLEQAFGNLIDNAIKYSSPERPIMIDITARLETGGRVAIDVADNGRGIAPEDHERIFDLFRRSGTQDKPGEGIGLAHVRTLVRSLGGDIRVRSKLNEGTIFTVHLPRDVRAYMRRNAK